MGSNDLKLTPVVVELALAVLSRGVHPEHPKMDSHFCGNVDSHCTRRAVAVPRRVSCGPQVHFHDACSLAPGADALINWQALSEPFEKTLRPSSASWTALRQACVRPIRCGQGGSHWLATFAETKWLGCRDETRQRSYSSIIPVDKILCSNTSGNI